MPVRLFIGSVTRDQGARRALDYALAYLVEPVRPDGEIDPDHEYVEPPLVVHVREMAEAAVVFLLLSPDWLSSAEGQAVTRSALALRRAGKAEVVGLCVRAWEVPTDLLAEVRILPTDAQGRFLPLDQDPPDSRAWLAFVRTLQPFLEHHARRSAMAAAPALARSAAVAAPAPALPPAVAASSPAPPATITAPAAALPTAIAAPFPALPAEPRRLVLGHYRLGAKVGRELAGEVFEATDLLGFGVWIKQARADHEVPEAVRNARLAREVSVLSSLDSPQVPKVYDFGEDPGLGRVIVLEAFGGETLVERLRRQGPMAIEELAPLAAQVWRGLADIHRAGVVHGQVLPSKIWLSARPGRAQQVVLLDFGACRRAGNAADLTDPGGLPGVLGFLPPESVGPQRDTGTHVDLYACAVSLFLALAGKKPHAARNALALLDLQQKTAARRLGEVVSGPVSPALDAFFARALDRDPARRFQSAGEALAAWEGCFC